MKSISIDENHKEYEIIGGALVNRKTKELILYPLGNNEETIIIPEGIKSIGAYAMMETKCVNLIIPDSVSSIEKSAFFSNEIENLTIGAGVKKMGNDAFRFSRKLQTVTIMEGATVIGAEAFENCKNLKSIVIPASVKQIGKDAFKDNYTVLIITPAKSVAAQYAQKNGLEHVEPTE